MINGGINFNKNSALESAISLSFFQNLDQLRLRSFSRLPKVRSDIREYLKEKYALKSLSYRYLFDQFIAQIIYSLVESRLVYLRRCMGVSVERFFIGI